MALSSGYTLMHEHMSLGLSPGDMEQSRLICCVRILWMHTGTGSAILWT